MTKIRATLNWLAGEWPVPRWICLLFITGAIANLIGR